MVNLIRPNLLIYETDILNLGGTVTYDGKIYNSGRRSEVKGAHLSLAGETYYVKMECFRDGTAAVIGTNRHQNGELFDAFWHLLEQDKNTLYHEYFFLRVVKQVLVTIAQIFLFIIWVYTLYYGPRYESVLSFGTSLTTIFLFPLLGTLYSKIRCYAFGEYIRNVNEDTNFEKLSRKGNK